MNGRLLKELAAEAGLTVEKYVHPYGHNVTEVVAIVTGDPWNALTALAEVILNNVAHGDDSRVELIDATEALTDLFSSLRSPKQTERNMDIILWWPTILWEEI